MEVKAIAVGACCQRRNGLGNLLPTKVMLCPHGNEAPYSDADCTKKIFGCVERPLCLGDLSRDDIELLPRFIRMCFEICNGGFHAAEPLRNVVEPVSGYTASAGGG